MQRDFQHFSSCSLILLPWPPGQFFWRIQLFCIPPTTQSKPVRYSHMSIRWYEVGVMRRRLALHLRLPWLVPYGLSTTPGEHQLLVSLTAGWVTLWCLLGTGQMPGWWQDKGPETKRWPLHLAPNCSEPPLGGLQPPQWWQNHSPKICNTFPLGCLFVLLFPLPLPADAGLDLRFNFHWTVKQWESRFTSCILFPPAFPRVYIKHYYNSVLGFCWY